jgi:uncharacterized membrane protein
MVDSIQLTRQIAVKTIVTENFKTQVSEEIARNLQQIETETQQMEFRIKRAIADLEKRIGTAASAEDRSQVVNLRGQMETEKIRLNQLKEEMQAQSKALMELPIGSVVTQFTLESPIQVRAGENLFQKLEGGEILVKDGIIQEIRV